MHKDTIPSKDADFDTFQNTVISYVTPKKVEFGIPDAVITSLTNAKNIWATIWAIAKIKNQRTSQQVVEKDQARETYESLLREFIQQYIMVNPAVSDGDRDAMDIKPRATEHAPIPAPDTIPLNEARQVTGHKVSIFFRQQNDEEGDTRRGKPEGVKFCEVAYSLNAVPANPNGCPNRELVTRSPKTMVFSQSQAGDKIYFYTRWVTAAGKPGQWSDLVTCMIP